MKTKNSKKIIEIIINGLLSVYVIVFIGIILASVFRKTEPINWEDTKGTYSTTTIVISNQKSANQ